MKVNTTQVYEICDLIHKYESASEQMKECFESFIKDTSIPLNDRWSIWVNAPSSLKNNSPWIYHWISSEFEDGIMYDGSIYCVEKYETVQVKEVFVAIHDLTDCELINLDIDEDKINLEKEKILSLNLGSYVYDW